jgi:hypothetical protein
VRPRYVEVRQTVKATGTVWPRADRIGSVVALKVVMKKGHGWVTVKTANTTLKAGSHYSWTYRAAKRGTYRMTARVKATSAYRADTSPVRTFLVRRS